MKSKNLIKYTIGLITVIILRIIPHPPNVEPIMSTMMPYAKKWGVFGGFIFSLLAIIIFDIITGTLGPWTIMTASTFSLLGVSAAYFFKKFKSRPRDYIIFSIIGTLAYDAITGIGTGMLFFNQPFMITFIGQIPFTLYHLGGNILLAGFLSPAIYKWIISNPKLETRYVIDIFKTKLGI